MKPYNKGKKLPAEMLSPSEIASLLDACSNRSLTGRRTRALIILLWRSGLRISEALALTPKDIDLQRGVIHVLHGKGDKQRQVAIDPNATAELAKWLEVRRKIPGVNGGPVFCSSHATPIHPSNIRRLLPILAKRAGIEKRVHPHAFRHVHAVELLNERVPLNLLSRQLGHSHLATTARYLSHVALPEMIDMAQARKWPAGAMEAVK